MGVCGIELGSGGDRGGGTCFYCYDDSSTSISTHVNQQQLAGAGGEGNLKGRE